MMLIFLADGSSFWNASTSPTCMASAKMPMPITMPRYGRLMAISSCSRMSSTVLMAAPKGMPVKFAGVRMILPSASKIAPALPSV